VPCRRRCDTVRRGDDMLAPSRCRARTAARHASRARRA
jgi:hypothetical protein